MNNNTRDKEFLTAIQSAKPSQSSKIRNRYYEAIDALNGLTETLEMADLAAGESLGVSCTILMDLHLNISELKDKFENVASIIGRNL